MGHFGLASIAFGVIYLVLQATGDGCPRYPPRSCHGPFTIRPSSPKKLPDAKSCSGDQAEMESCLTQCMHDPCCRAFGVHSGNCTMANFSTEAYDFVKEASAWPVASDICLNHTGCAVAIGAGGHSARVFSLSRPFIQSASELRAISGAIGEGNTLAKIAVDYGNGFQYSYVLPQDMQSFRCELEVGEYITGVTGYIVNYEYPMVVGIQFNTTQKTCGPYGRVTNMVETVSGHMLLYVEGSVAGFAFAFDMLKFVFHKC